MNLFQLEGRSKQADRNSNRRQRLHLESLEPRAMMTAVAMAVYDDGALNEPWQNWSWNTDLQFGNRVPKKAGSTSIAVLHNEAWSGMYFGTGEEVASRNFGELQFSLHGGETGGQSVNLFLVDGDSTWLSAGSFSPTANRWTDHFVDLRDVGSPNRISGIVLQDADGRAQSPYFIDEIAFLSDDDSDDGQTPPPITGPSITIDSDTVIGEISEDIYGLNFVDEAFARELDIPVSRWGGNSTSRYNFKIDATNRGSDWFFENHPSDANTNVSRLPDGSSLDLFVEGNDRAGAKSLVTVGMTGWTAKGREIVGGFSVEKYGPQQDVDPWRAYGNGVRPDGSLITGNDPFDTSIQADEAFTTEMVSHLVSQYGTAAHGGVQYYALGNEPMLWNSTHRDVHPEPASYEEVLQKGINHAASIKSVDPTAEVLGPTSWGWTGYFYSALDMAGGGAFWANPRDRNAHGGQAFLPWYLDQMAEAEQETGQRLLDYLDIHYYPQHPGVTLTREAGTPATQAARLESTRSLWDPTYVDPTWINEDIQLIPRMKAWIDQNYPGTKLAITEYNFGGTADINGAVAQADVLGIFGREGVDLATMWAPPESSDPTAYAFRMYRNYDGDGQSDSRFGEKGILATSSDDKDVSVFASIREVDGALTVMLINKSTEAQTSPVTVPSEYVGLDAERYTYGENNLRQIVRGDDVEINDATVALTLPGHSITLLELPSPRLTASAFDSSTNPITKLGGDMDSDGSVNFSDFLAFATAGFRESGATWSDGDFDGDEKVTFRDFLELANNFGKSVDAVFAS